MHNPCPSRAHRRTRQPTVGTQHDGPGRAFSPFYATLNDILYGNFAF